MRNARLMTGCALGAMLSAFPLAAAAQSYLGGGTVVTGVATIAHNPDGGPGIPASTTVLVASSEVVIDWAPVDLLSSGAIDFQPEGTVAFFQSDPFLADYTVLNRVLPVDGADAPIASTVAFRGTTTALLGNAPGGQIWFYSPTGIIAGPTAVFNVGSLILTTNEIPVTVGGPNPLYGPGGEVQFLGPAGSTGFVEIQPGAQINATGANAYVALVAPRVVQGGLVQADGQIAYIAAEQLDMTINGGLFDFEITVGTTDPNGVVHTGTSTGPASTSAADQQRIAMVALPKNDALTMLLSGSAGYTPAATAANEGSSLVLAAGFTNDTPAAVPANRLGSIEIANTTFRNALQAYSTDTTMVAPTAGTTLFEADSSIYAANFIGVTVSPGDSVQALGNLSLRAGVPGTGGVVSVQTVGGGTIDVGGVLRLDASSDAADYDTVTPFLDAQGGAINLAADGGRISAPLAFLADVSGLADADPVAAGIGTGGSIEVALANAGIIESSTLTLVATGAGGQSVGTGGDGVGGSVTVVEGGGELDLGSFRAIAAGLGGEADTLSGNGTGGLVGIEIGVQAQDWDELFVDASSAAGRPSVSATAGSATSLPAAARLAVSGTGSVTVQTTLDLLANAQSQVNGGAGFGGQAGGTELAATAGGSITADTIALASDALLADGLSEEDPSTSPLQNGGSAIVLADGGAIAARFVTVSAGATGSHATTAAAAATGGAAQVIARDGGTILIEDVGGIVGAGLVVSANGRGAAGQMAANAAGGTARIAVEDGSITVRGDALVSGSASLADLIAVSPGPGLDATGGNAIVQLLAGTLGTASLAADNLQVRANGDARLTLLGGSGAPQGDPISGDGGAGTGGLASVSVEAGSLATGVLLLESVGVGGASTDTDNLAPFASGSGTGGTSHLTHSGGATTVTSLSLLSNGIGGGGAPDPGDAGLVALAGNGTGGAATLDITGGTLEVGGPAAIEANGTGGEGMNHGGTGDATDGGHGFGGTATLRSAAGAAGFFDASDLAIRSNGAGGLGGTAASALSGNGGDGTGGTAIADLADGSLGLGGVAIEATGTGADGVTGGHGIGGAATFSLVDVNGPSGARTLDGLSIVANGVAGLSGGLLPEQSDAGDVQLTARIFDSASGLVVNGSVVLNSLGGTIGAFSGAVVDTAGAPLTIGGNFTIEAGDITITADEPINAAADAFVSAERNYQSTGLVATDGLLTVQGGLGVNAGRLAAGGTANLSGGTGPLLVADLAAGGAVTAFGNSVDIRSLGALQFGSAQASGGDLFIETAGNLGAGTVSAAGSATLHSTAGSIVNGGVTAGTWIEGDAAGGVTLGNLVAPIDIAIAAHGGNLTVGDVTAGDEIWLSVFGTDPANILTAGNLVSTGLGDDTAAGPPSAFGSFPGGAGPVGNVTRIRSAGSLALGNVQTPGRAILVADAGTTTAGTVSATEAVIVLGHGDIALDSALTAGRFYVADSAMFLPNLPDAYDPASLNGPGPERTAGGLVLGAAVEAADITVAVGGDAVGPGWTSAGALTIDAGGQFSAAEPVAAGGDASVTADGGIALAALTSGGTTLLRATGGTVDVDNLLSAGTVTAGGQVVDIRSTGALTFADLDATAGDIAVVANGDLALATADAAGAILLRSTEGEVAAAGTIFAGGSATVDGPGGVTLPFLRSGAATQLASPGGTVAVDTLVSAGTVAVSGGAVDIGGSGNLTFTAAQADDTMAIAASGNLAFASVSAGNSLSLSSATGSLTASGDVDGGSTQLDAAGAIAIAGTLDSRGTLVTTAGGPFSVAGAASSDDADITADGGITMTSLDSGEITRLLAPGGSVAIGELLTAGRVTAVGLNVDIASSGALNFEEVGGSAGDVSVVTAGDLSADRIGATGAIDLDSGATFTLRGAAHGATIAVQSNDIVLDPAAELGLRGLTSQILLASGAGATRTVIGDGVDAASGDYALDQGEAARLFADESIEIASPGAIAVGDLALTYGASGNLGTGATLELTTPTEVSITGDVMLATSGAEDTFLIDPALIELNTATGSIAMLGGNGAPLGRLAMIGDTIAIATPEALVQLRTATDMAAINALLDQSGGNPQAVRAGTLSFEVADGLYIQNSGPTALYRDRQGFTAGGLAIVTTSANTRIAVNGQILTASGPVIGLDTQSLVTINDAPAAAGGLFDPVSTINGCVIGSRCAPPSGSGPPTSEDIDSPIPPGDDPGSLFRAPLIELAETAPLIAPPLVDEPITGVGNDDLWEPRCVPGGPGEACPQDDERP